MSGNPDFVSRSLRSVWHPCTQMKLHEASPLIPIAHGKGVWLYDFENRRYLDAISSWWVNLFGHGNPTINEALKQQLDKLEHVMLAGFTHEPVILLSERLAELTGLGHAFYSSDGASATEIALKMSFHFWRNQGKPSKSGFLRLQNGYHGETAGALSVTDIPLFKETYRPLLRESAVIPSPDWRLADPGETAEAFAIRCADALKSHLELHADNIAALIIEPMIQCASGMGMYSKVYLQKVRALCHEFNIHLIADEIAVGFGRTGTMFACEQANIRPDFMCLSKGITGGYLPLSVTLTTDEIYQAFYDDRVERGFLHSHSYTGNALACSAALATLDIFETQNVLSKNQIKSKRLTALLSPISMLEGVKHFRNMGMIWAFDIVGENPNFSRDFYIAALSSELLLRPINRTVYLMPPYVLNEEETDFLSARLYQLAKQFSQPSTS